MGKLKKIESNQKLLETVVIPFSGNGWNTISGSTLKFTAVQKSADNGRAFSNLYSSFNLPLISAQTNSFLSTWARTGFSGLSQDNIIVAEVPSNTYGELIDGRTVRFIVPNNTGGTYTLYSSYYEPQPFSSDNSDQGEYFGNPILKGSTKGKPGLASSNVAFIFSDDIKVPTMASSNPNISNWSDGWAIDITPNGYDGGGTDNFRFTDVVTSSNTPKAYAQSQDIPVGICYLDKGFMVLTDPTIVGNFRYSGGTEDGSTVYSGASSGFTNLYFTGSTLASCSYYSFEKEWVMSINVVADSGEFYITENQSAASPEAPYYGAGGTDTGIQFKTPFGDVNQVWDLSDVSSSYITEIGLYDAQNRLLAVAKPDRPIKKDKNTPVTLTLKLKF